MTCAGMRGGRRTGSPQWSRREGGGGDGSRVMVIANRRGTRRQNLGSRRDRVGFSFRSSENSRRHRRGGMRRQRAAGAGRRSVIVGGECGVWDIGPSHCQHAHRGLCEVGVGGERQGERG